MSVDGAGQLELFASADPVACADVQCICTHYGIEHDMRQIGQPCQARDLFGEPCDCFGYEPDPDHQDDD